MQHTIIYMADWYDKILAEYHKERQTAKFYKTRGYGRLLVYVDAVIQSDKFQKTMLRMRDKYKVPAKGFDDPISGSWSSHPPKKWAHAEDNSILDIRRDIQALCREYGLLPRDWDRTLENYLFYNRLMPTLEPNAKNLCFISDGVTGKDSLGHVVDDIDREIYPITLHISAYAGIKDILDYVNKVYNPEIMRLQEPHRKSEIKIKKFRKRNKVVRERGIVMNANPHDSNKKMAKLINEKFPERPLRLSSIGKTSARERKRRQEL